jgi:hypothetical protein
VISLVFPQSNRNFLSTLFSLHEKMPEKNYLGLP